MASSIPASLSLPTCCNDAWCCSWSVARPKSRILACPREVTKMLAGLMSRWTMPFECAASSASAISMAMSSNSFSSGGCCFSVLIERFAFQQLHGDEVSAFGLTNLMDSTYVADDSALRQCVLLA